MTSPSASSSTHAHSPLVEDFISMLEGASHVGALRDEERAIFITLDAALAPSGLHPAILQLVLAAWTAYLVQHRDTLTEALWRDHDAAQIAAALYLALDLHMPLREERIERGELLQLFSLSEMLDEAIYEEVASLARPIFSYFSGLSPDVFKVILNELHTHQHGRHHAERAHQIHAQAVAFWEAEIDEESVASAIASLQKGALILRLEILPHAPVTRGGDEVQDEEVPEPSMFFVVKDAQRGEPRVLLPWFGELDALTRQDAMRRALLEAMLAPHMGEPALPVAIVAPTERDVKSLTLKLGIPEVVVLSPSQMPEK